MRRRSSGRMARFKKNLKKLKNKGEDAPPEREEKPVRIDPRQLFDQSASAPAPVTPVQTPSPGNLNPVAGDGGMARLVEENKILRKLKEVFASLSAETTIEGFSETALDLAMALSKTERALIAGADPDGPTVLAVKAFSGSFSGRDLEVARHLTGLVIQHGRDLLTENVEADERFRSLGADGTGLKSFLIVPLVFKRAVLGALYLGNPLTPAAYGDRDRKLYTGFAQQAAIVLANLLVHDQRDAELDQMRTTISSLQKDIEERDERIAELEETDMTPLFDLSLKKAERTFRKRFLKGVLARNGGDVDLAAREVGVHPKKLIKLLRESGLNVRVMSEEEARKKAEEAGIDDKPRRIVRRRRRRRR